MRIFRTTLKWLPMVWVVFGLLFILGGLGLDHGYALSFAFIALGTGCGLYGLLLFFFSRRERPQTPEARRLSPNFISIGATTVFAPRSTESTTPTEQPDA